MAKTSKEVQMYERQLLRDKNKHPGSRLMRILDWYIDPPADDLATMENPKDEAHRLLLSQIFSLRVSHSKLNVKKIICKSANISERQAYKYMQDAETLFGDFVLKEVSVKAGRNAQVERYERLAEKAENAGDIEIARKCLIRIDILRGYDQQDTLDPEELIKRLEIPAITFTTDPAALEAEDTEYEDVENEEEESIRK